MELKDVILSAIAEIGEEAPPSASTTPSARDGARPEATTQKAAKAAEPEPESAPVREEASPQEEERAFLEHLRERLLVLFEGFQSPNNRRVEAKIDLTLNFLEYLLALLDERIERLKKP